jgi:hypothetical protein
MNAFFKNFFAARFPVKAPLLYRTVLSRNIRNKLNERAITSGIKTSFPAMFQDGIKKASQFQLQNKIK